MWAILRRLLMVLVFGIASFAVTLFVGMSFATAVRTESVRIRRKFVALTLGCAVVIVVVTVSVVVVEASSTAATIWTASAKGVDGILTVTEIGGIRVSCEDFGFRSIRGSSGRCRRGRCRCSGAENNMSIIVRMGFCE